MKLVITGGHHSSALPVIHKLQKDHPAVEIYWLGHRNTLKGDTTDSLEYKEITSLGIPFYELKAGKLYRTYDLKRLARIPYGFFQAWGLLSKIKPDLVLSFGGYLAVPVVIAGWLKRIPSITHEQTLTLGYANKLISHFAEKILISWHESDKYFPTEKVVYTGLPLRQSLFQVSSNSFLLNENLPTIYITAGKTGSHKVNEVVKKALPELLGMVNVIHQCGDHATFRDYDELKEIYSSMQKKPEGAYFLRKFVFENEIGEVFAKSDFLISRSGAHTCCEILVLRKKAILIPIPWVSHNEQMENARVLEKEGLAVILPEKDLTPAALIAQVEKLLLVPVPPSRADSIIADDSQSCLRHLQPVQKIVDIILSYEKTPDK